MDTGTLWSCQHIRLKRCRDGALIYNINDLYIGRALDIYGEITQDQVSYFRQLVHPGMTILDAGSNIGVFTLTLAKRHRL